MEGEGKGKGRKGLGWVVEGEVEGESGGRVSQFELKNKSAWVHIFLHCINQSLGGFLALPSLSSLAVCWKKGKANIVKEWKERRMYNGTPVIIIIIIDIIIIIIIIIAIIIIIHIKVM